MPIWMKIAPPYLQPTIDPFDVDPAFDLHVGKEKIFLILYDDFINPCNHDN